MIKFYCAARVFALSLVVSSLWRSAMDGVTVIDLTIDEKSLSSVIVTT